MASFHVSLLLWVGSEIRNLSSEFSIVLHNRPPLLEVCVRTFWYGHRKSVNRTKTVEHA